jgi:hypothetical protein
VANVDTVHQSQENIDCRKIERRSIDCRNIDGRKIDGRKIDCRIIVDDVVDAKSSSCYKCSCLGCYAEL